ncbi:hypothetical protein HMPREF9087_2264 [Enterococcus casseliflavus ATCC 12755]|jgi:hypothetical protein|uniref:Uncharacterized protein n=1 Tax=Enterococcus casseliflavus ATCC 12755 TaxID=888066 RepID=F0ELH2_ENTCA|nr:hypothetical protein HMPREF9087_2264 [Enterococcus casseliflavus ATCC 12755]EPH67247.1 hypothetical protein D931_00975 [Enterococcus faecium 13.SD.W.09]
MKIKRMKNWKNERSSLKNELFENILVKVRHLRISMQSNDAKARENML